MVLAPCLTTYYPKDLNKFTKDSAAWVALNKGYNISINQEGMIVDTWDPITGELFDNLDNEIGNRTDPIEKLYRASVQVGGLRTWTPADTEDPDCPCQFKEFFDQGYLVTTDPKGNAVDIWHPETTHVVNDNYQILGSRVYPYLSDLGGFKTGTTDTVETLNFPEAIITKLNEVASEYPQMQVTINPSDVFVEFWDPVGLTIYDFELNVLGVRSTPYNAKRWRNIAGQIITYKPLDQKNEALSTQVAALLAKGYWVTMSRAIDIIDIWDPKKHQVLDTQENIISSRLYPFPSENNLSALELEIKLLKKHIEDLGDQAEEVYELFLPRSYIMFGASEADTFGSLPPSAGTLIQDIFNEIGRYLAVADNEGKIIDIQKTSNKHVYSIVGYNVNTLEDKGARQQQFEAVIDPATVRASQAEIMREGTVTEADLRRRQNWLKGMKRLKKRLNIAKTIKRINK